MVPELSIEGGGGEIWSQSYLQGESQKKKKSRRLSNSISTRFLGKSDPFVTVKQGSEGREKFRTRTIDNTLEPVWNESTVVAMPDTNGLLLLVTTYVQWNPVNTVTDGPKKNWPY